MATAWGRSHASKRFHFLCQGLDAFELVPERTQAALAQGGLLKVGEIIQARRRHLLMLRDVGKLIALRTIDQVIIAEHGAKALRLTNLTSSV